MLVRNSKGRVRLWRRPYKLSRQSAHGLGGLRFHWQTKYGRISTIEPHKRVPGVMDNVLHIAVTIPVTSSQAERPFIAMERIKNYLRSTMGNTRPSDIGVLNVNAQMLYALNKESVSCRFAEISHRIQL